MTEALPQHVRGLLAYLNQPNERANEDLALQYFRKVFGEAFTRQKEAKRADGYVAGSFVVELKGETSDWLSGLFQGLAYRNLDLDFTQIVVLARQFVAVWQVDDIPIGIREEMAIAEGPPNAAGRRFAEKYSSRRSELLRLAIWNGASFLGPLFASQPDVIIEQISAFEKTLRDGRKVRQRVTVRNFTTILKQMVGFFEPDQPIKAVRAFYSMVYDWSETSTVQLSQRTADQAALGGELITHLRPASRLAFKEFVDRHYVWIAPGGDHDDFFSLYDVALDTVDPDFRRQHGIFFTDLLLSKFVLWLSKRDIPKLGQDYIVIDPACGSGNLVTNWRSPLELRHKVVSEIEPELLFAIERRMKGDVWHNSKFTVVPKVSENRGLNFLDRSAEEWLDALRTALREKGIVPDKPLAFLCNPPYRSDDDQGARSAPYQIHPSILELIGRDASSERYCCFLAQMKRVCETASSSGLPGDSLLLLLTKSAWLTQRSIFAQIREEMLGAFESVAGVLVNGSEFFDVKGSWPVAFTVWRHKGPSGNLDAGRPIELLDLTWLKRDDLRAIPWDNSAAAELGCASIVQDGRARTVSLGERRTSIRQWSGETMLDFKRDRRKSEAGLAVVGGLPAGDARRANKKTYGDMNGQYVGFMDDLTPCRVSRSEAGRPWFRLNGQFMDIKKNRCLSGPPTHLGYCAADLASAKKLFFWYSLARTFLQRRYPMWVDADDMWEPVVDPAIGPRVFSMAFSIGYAENECVETHFPANNPAPGLRELFVENPMTPIDPQSFWSTTLRPFVDANGDGEAKALVDAVDQVYSVWRSLFGVARELPVGEHRTYFVDGRTLTPTAGLVQIRDYAVSNDHRPLLSALAAAQASLKTIKDRFYDLIVAEQGVNYFGTAPKSRRITIPDRTRFDKVLCRRLAVAGLAVAELHSDPSFGRTKLAKVFYLADERAALDLETEYVREAAGPLDQRALYNTKVGIEALARKYLLFGTATKGKMIRYEPMARLPEIELFAELYLGEKAAEVVKIIRKFEDLTTDQTEIVATLFACWNDFLIRGHPPTDEEIVSEFRHQWHPKKSRFSSGRLARALKWMRDQDMTPTGRRKPTRSKPDRLEEVVAAS